MKFVDQVRVQVRAGNGGDGVVAWRREKFVPRGGPAGGDGGKGGDIVLVADPGLSTLLDLQYRQHLQAEHGRSGGSRGMYGRGGEDLEVRVPVGTMVFVEGAAGQRGEAPPSRKKRDRAAQVAASSELSEDEDEDDEDDEDEDEDDGEGMENIYVGGPEPGFVVRDDELPEDLFEDEEPERPSGFVPEPGTLLGDLTEPGQRLVVARGGRGGRGNIHFRSSTNRAPHRADPGEPGEGLWLRLELKLLADVGIVGYPNVGKSTLISRVSQARPRVADYPFTTLVPQLGVVSLSDRRTMVLADVPGLIEGAAEGKGLGLQFLRHLERTSVLLHVLAPDLDPDRDPLADLDVIEGELARYGSVFEGKPRVVALNKIDVLADPEGQRRIKELKRSLRERNIPLFQISAATGEGIESLLEALWRRVAALRQHDHSDDPLA